MFSIYRIPIVGLATWMAAAFFPAYGLPPSVVVNSFHSTLTDAMTRGPLLACPGRQKLLQAVVERSFDLPFIAERALRRHWKTLDPVQQHSFTEALQRSVVTTYATEFATPGAARFETLSDESLANGDALVRTMLIPAEGSRISLDYVLKARGEHWQIVNVLAEGVSDLALRASQYHQLMKTQGFDALHARLETQTEQTLKRCR